VKSKHVVHTSDTPDLTCKSSGQTCFNKSAVET